MFGKAGGLYENDYKHAQNVGKKNKKSKKNILHLIKTNTTMMRNFQWNYRKICLGNDLLLLDHSGLDEGGRVTQSVAYMLKTAPDNSFSSMTTSHMDLLMIKKNTVQDF